jgi:hypothetical protein
MTVKPVKSPVLAYSQTNSRSTYEPPEYDLAELNIIEDVDSYVRQVHRKKVGLAFKEGWDLVGKNVDTLNYIKKRFVQLEHAQGKPWRILMKELFYDLVKHANAYLVKVRNDDISGGFTRNAGGTRIKPVAGYFVMPPETVEIAKDNSGKVVRVRQVMPSGRKKEYAPDLVVHFTLDKKTGFSTGTPILVPVKDDIRALRRIEENIDLLVYQNLFPMFQYKVGTEKMPAQTYPDGQTEIDVVRTELEYMPPEGILVTPERHEISMIGSEGRALRAEGYLKHFKERVLAGLGTSSVDMGEGGTSNKNTADRLSDNLRDDVKAIQDDFEAQFDFMIIRELLLEGRFGVSILDPDNVVHLKFKEIDIERLIKFENHVAQMYAQHTISEDEMRVRIGQDPIPLDDEDIREKMYWSIIEQPSLLIKSMDESSGLSAATDNPQVAVESKNAREGEARLKRIAAAKPTSTSTTTTKNRGQKAGASQDRPSNQRGTRDGPKMKRDFVDTELLTHVEQLLDDVSAYLKSDATDAWIKTVIRAWTEQTNKRQARLVRGAFTNGFRSTGLNPYLHDLASYVRIVEKHSSHYVHKLARNLEDRFTRLTGEEDKSTMMSIMDITVNRVNAINESEQQRAYNYGRLIAFRLTDQKVRFVSHEGACEECVKAEKNGLDPKKLSVEDIPPVHPFCGCSIEKE